MHSGSLKKIYEDVGRYSEGMCRVSAINLHNARFEYHNDWAEIAGCWGFVNTDGDIVISPQYVYAQDFNGGIAIVAKGKWDEVIDYGNSVGLWTIGEAWGGIDKSGKEVIPFVFDEIKYIFTDDEWHTDVYKAHFGGWENGHWGIIDRNGNWLAEPVFDDIGYDYKNGMFAYYRNDLTDNNVGIYDIKSNKVLFEPQFYNIGFLDNGDIKTEIYDRKQGSYVKEIIRYDDIKTDRENRR